MQPFWPTLAALAVAAIYYAWRAFDEVRRRRDRTIRQRVAYMLFVMATQGTAKTREIPRVSV
jgi:hypothetical protein